MSDVFANPEHVGFWEAARRAPAGEKVDWEEFLAGSRCVSPTFLIPGLFT
jgi:hypothetical protein